MAKAKNTKKSASAEKTTFTLKIDLRTIVWVLVALNVLTLFLWKPWSDDSAAKRTISVTGESTVEAEPDRFQFNPSYDLVANSQEAVLADATDKANEVIDGLKAIGVEDKDIKLDTSSYGYWWYDEDEDKNRTSVYITVDVDNRELAQAVQDFLLTTEPEGQITPWPTFSDAKEKSLETEARELAIEDARSKAEQSAEELGLKVGKVVSVNEGYGFGGIDIAFAETASLDDGGVARSSLPVQPGENEYNFSVTVVFEIK